MSVISLSLLQWNAFGVQGKLHLLRAAVEADNVDVILLQETLLPKGSTTTIKGYKAFHLISIIERIRGCSIHVRDSIPCVKLSNSISCGDGVEVIAVKLHLLPHPLTV